MTRPARQRPPVRAVCGEDPAGRFFREKMEARGDDPAKTARLYYPRCRYSCDADLATLRLRDRVPGRTMLLHLTVKPYNVERGLLWQVTEFAGDEPTGDRPFRTCEDALAEVAGTSRARIIGFTRQRRR